MLKRGYFLNFYANFYAYLLANFGTLQHLGDFYHIFTAHAQMWLFVHFLSQF